MSRALVTGVAGQDGIYLARLLRARGTAVTGVVLPGGADAARVAAYLGGVDVVELDLRDSSALTDLVLRVAPDEVYNLAAVSSVGQSWQAPELTHAVNATAVEVLVAAVLAHRAATGTDVRLFQASSAETGPGAAASPYARSKAVAEEVVRAAREEHGLHASIGHLHIHESPLRPESFVARKITLGAAAIALGLQHELRLGRLDVVRDWGFAADYVEAVRRLLASDVPQDLPIGSGVPHTLGDLVAAAFAAAGLGEHDRYVVADPDLQRPADTPVLVADPEPAARTLGWRATTTLEQLVAHMVRVDLERLRTGVADDRSYLDPGVVEFTTPTTASGSREQP